MSFIQPLALLFGLLAGLIVLMYLLKLKRRREEFSSTLLWMRAVEDLTANAPFQKLRQNLLMWLQIIALLLLVLALARPTMWLNRRSGSAHIVLVDNSASMNATDGDEGGTRLDEALRRVDRLIANLQTGDRMMIVSFGGRAAVVQPFTVERGLLRGALDKIEPTDGPTGIREAMLLAQSVRKVDPGAGIVIVSDGGLGYLGELIGEDDPVEFIGVGSGNDNRGIVAFDVRESFEKRGTAQVFASVRNYSDKPAQVMMRCLIDGEVAEVREREVEGGGKAAFAFAGLRGNDAVIRMELVGEDLLAADDAVEGIVSLDDSMRILLVTNGNFFLERILSLLPGAVVSKVSPASHGPGGSHDMIVFDQFSPEAVGPGNYMFINAVPPLEGFAAAEERIEMAAAIDWNRLHPVTRFVNFEGLGAEGALDLDYPDWAVSLVDSTTSPLIVAGERRGFRAIVIGFDIYATDWPLGIGFPVFMSNAAGWLLQKGEGANVSIHRTGATVAVEGDPKKEAPIEVVAPDEAVITLDANENGVAYFNETGRTGVYRARQGATDLGRFAVNLLSEQESDIAPREEIVSGERAIAATSVERENREVWHWFAMLGIALLTVEWHMFCRRSWL